MKTDKTSKTKKDKNEVDNESTINIMVSGFPVQLCATQPPPSAEDLFHLMFFHEEIPKTSTHFRQQRWNKRRISKRWTWKRGREREIYERRAEYLRGKWKELKTDYISNENKLSDNFLNRNRTLALNINGKSDELIIDENTNFSNSQKK